uniref:CARD domain-containing protein n=1 Tax=Arion vulgaris TaxID=1028688 RepID=A0A0B7A090_9EUPU
MESENHIVQTIIAQNEFLLRRHLVLSRSVLDQMKTSGLITDVTRRKILMEPAHRQVPTLLKSLEHKGLLSLRKFLDVLRNTGHGWMVDNILDTDVTANGQGRTKDDIGYSGRFQPAYTRHQAQIVDTNRRSRHLLKPDFRKSVTAGVTGYDSQLDKGVSLGSILKAKHSLTKTRRTSKLCPFCDKRRSPLGS